MLLKTQWLPPSRTFLANGVYTSTVLLRLGKGFTTFRVLNGMMMLGGAQAGISKSLHYVLCFYVSFFRRFGDRHRKLMQLASAYDNLSAKQCHGKPLPCSLNNTAICTPQEDADAIYRLGNYEYAYKSVIAFSLVLVLADGDDEYSYRWRIAENSTLYSALTMGAWFIELQDHINGKIDGSNNVKYFHK